MKKPIIKGSIRRRLSVLLTIVAGIIAIFLFFLIQSVARQIAQSSQDNILLASAISIVDSSRFNKGEFSIDLPYSSLSMLDTVTDERVFYSIKLENKFLSGYKLLPQADGRQCKTIRHTGQVLQLESAQSLDVPKNYDAPVGDGAVVGDFQAGQLLSLGHVGEHD